MFYFLHGNSPMLELEMQSIIKDIEKKNPSISKQIYDANLKETDAFISAISTNSIFGDNDIYILKRSEFFKAKGLSTLLKTLKIYDFSQKEVIVVYEEFLNYGKIIKEYELSKTTIKQIEEIGENIDCSSDKYHAKISQYIKSELDTSDYETDKLIEIIGGDFYKLKNEVMKIKNFLDGKKLDLEYIIPILSVDKKYSLSILVDNFLKKRDYKSLLEFFFKNETEEAMFLYVLAEELITMLKLNELIKNSQLRSSINYNEFKIVYEKIKDKFLNRYGRETSAYPIYLKLAAVKLYDSDFLKKKLEELLEVEYAFKSGHMDMTIAIETFISSFFKELD